MIELSLALLIQFAGVISAETANTPHAYKLGACTVRNRIEAGWSPDRVMAHYYAPWVQPDDAQIDAMRAVMAGDLDCPPVYFVYSDEGAERIFGTRHGGLTVCDDRGLCNVFMTIDEYHAAGGG